MSEMVWRLVRWQPDYPAIRQLVKGLVRSKLWHLISGGARNVHRSDQAPKSSYLLSAGCNRLKGGTE